MKLAGPAAERRGDVEIIADRQPGLRGYPGRTSSSKRSILVRDPIGRICSLALIIGFERPEQGVVPARPLVGDEPLEDAEHQRLGLALLVKQGPGAPGNPVELRLLGEELADLEVGVDPRFEPPEDLEDQPIAEEDRRIALLERADDDSQRLVFRPSGGVEGPGGDAQDRSPRSRSLFDPPIASSRIEPTAGSDRAS